MWPLRLKSLFNPTIKERTIYWYIICFNRNAADKVFDTFLCNNSLDVIVKIVANADIE